MSYDEVVVPLDGSQLAEYIIPHVENMARAFKSRVTLFHVIEAGEPDPERLTPSQRAARADITKYLERVSEVLERQGVRVEWRISFGDPATQIVRLAHEKAADLVMMSTRGRGDTGRGGLGSVSMAVASSGEVPVMVVKPPDEVAKL